MALVIAVLGEPIARLVRQLDRDVAVGKLRLELQDELVDDLGHDLARQAPEGHDCVEAIAKLRREQLVDRLDVVALALVGREAVSRAGEVEAPAFVVMMMMTLRKSTCLPL
jgi:hypothetical protein